jgi:phage gpG-like protein
MASSGLRFDGGLVIFDFQPSIGIVASRYNTLGHKLSDFSEPLHEAITKVMIPSFAENFASGGRPEWTGLSEDTIKMAGDHDILIKSGNLEGAATSEGIWQVSSKSAAVTGMPADAWYGAIHQQGYGGGATGAIPARPFIVFQDEDEYAIEEVFSDWLDRQIGAV